MPAKCLACGHECDEVELDRVKNGQWLKIDINSGECTARNIFDRTCPKCGSREIEYE